MINTTIETTKRTFILGDVHGAYPALKQVLTISGFNKEEDRLVCLGDFCDGWPYVPECFDEILSIKHLDYIMGNHDWWAYQFYSGKAKAEDLWLKQGGYATLHAYERIGGMPTRHLELLEKSHVAIESYINGKHYIFVHGGINPDKPFDQQIPSHCMWDRELLINARNKHQGRPHVKYGGYDQIFVGHTSTQFFNRKLAENTKPVTYCNVTDIDTGAGWSGKLTIMNVDTREYWQSDNVLQLMPDDTGRELRF